MKKVCLILIAAITLLLSSCGDEEIVQEYYYFDNNDTTQGLVVQYDDLRESYIVKSSISNDIEEIAIPSIINDKEVKEIGDNAFDSCENLKEITIPNTIERIGKEVFKNCKLLKEIAIPESVNYFKGTERSESLELTKYPLFNGCDSLEKMTIPSMLLNKASTKVIESVINYAFSDLFANDIPSRLKEVKIVGETIPDYCFTGCETIETIVMDKTIEIGSYAFNECSAIKEIIIPTTAKKINSYAFNNCSSLEEMYVPRNVEEIHSNAFSGCSSLKKLTVPFIGRNKNTSYDMSYIFGDVLPLLEEVTVLNDGLAATSFENFTSIKKITISSDSTSIYQKSFNNCTSLEEIRIDSNVQTISINSFSKCSSLKRIYFLKGIKEIEEKAFNDCTLTAINFSGTLSDWNKIEKSSLWKVGSRIEQIICSNGTITIN